MYANVHGSLACLCLMQASRERGRYHKWGLLCNINPFLLSPFFHNHSNQCLFVVCHVHVWQVSTQLCCGDTCQTWTGFNRYNVCYTKLKLSQTNTLTNEDEVTPTVSWLSCEVLHWNQTAWSTAGDGWVLQYDHGYGSKKSNTGKDFYLLFIYLQITTGIKYTNNQDNIW